MRVADLDRVAAIAAIGFPDHFEDRGCFANRLGLNPGGCFVLEIEGAVKGYLVAYPWRRGSVPTLNARIESIPADADVLYLHDLAIDPAVRGQGWPGSIIDRLAADARNRGWPAITLVAVNDAAGFWERHGFEVAGDVPAYGPDARSMIRRL